MADGGAPAALAGLLRGVGGPLEALGAVGRALDALPFGVVLYDAAENAYPILYLNAAAERFAGLSGAGAAGRARLEAFTSDEPLGAVFDRLRDSGRSWHARRRDASSGTAYDVDVMPLRDGRGDVRHLLQTLLEVAEGERVERAPAALEGIARRLSEAESARRVLQTGIDATIDLVGLPDPEDVIERLVERAARQIDAERVLLYSEEAAGTYVRAGHDVEAVPIAAGHRPSPALRAQMEQVRRTGGQLRKGPDSEEQLAGLDPAVAAAARCVRHGILAPLFDQGRVIGFLDVLRRHEPDFSAEDLATLALIVNVAVLGLRNAGRFRELSEISRAKSQFLNMAAHELRTPLSVINGYASMLAEGSFGQAPADWGMPLRVLVEKSRELGHLIDDILLASRLESGRAFLTGYPLELSNLVREAAGRAGPRARLLGARVDLDVPDAEVWVTGHEEQVGRILDNLINNALTYSRDRPTIGLQVGLEPAAGVVRIEDRGLGVALEHRERIFEQFFRVEDTAQGYPPGTGLGLYIARTLAERCGGGLALEWTEVGRGSRFALRLPLAPRGAGPGAGPGLEKA